MRLVAVIVMVLLVAGCSAGRSPQAARLLEAA